MLKDKVAIVTGAAGGIGRSTARRFVEEGARVVLVDRDETPLAEAARDVGGETARVVGDVTDPETARRMVSAAVEQLGGLDILFANAGMEGAVAPVLEQDPASFQRVFEVNVLGVLHGVQAAGRAMAERGGGSIVITSSVAGLIGSPGLAPYITSKHAVIDLMRTAAVELAPSKVRVNTVNPGPVDNRMMRSIEEQASPGESEQVRAGFTARVPLGRYATNEEIADLVTFLASDRASYCTGQIYLADGGFTTG